MQGKTSYTGTKERPIGEPSGEDVLYGILSHVAEVKGCDPLELRPLSEAVDPDAVETLLADSNANVDVGFPYEGGYVRVNESGVRFDDSL